ncbi:MAG TPA: TetR family transcriptional regulator C-terminal domain-containing protein [Actinomycetota bacterium]|nr:TetR family transcriptional regulator C-terminal domain-containing protein [Actinomycetota bacterium]
MLKEPATKRGKATRDRLVAAADAMIAERGVEGASLDQILASADVSKSQLYHYFDGKDELVRAVIARRRAEIIGRQTSLLPELDSWDAIETWLKIVYEGHESHGFRGGCPIGSLANELADKDDRARLDLAEGFEAWQGLLVDGLNKMRARGEIKRSADPYELATAVFAAMQGGLLLAKTRREPEPLRIALDAARAHLRSYKTVRTKSRPRKQRG